NGKLLATAGLLSIWGKSDQVRIWDLATRKEIRRIAGGASLHGFSPDGKLLAGWGEDWAVRVRDATTGQERLHLPSHQRSPLSFLPDGKHLLVKSDGQVFRIWDLDTQREVRQLRTEAGRDSGLGHAIDPDGKILATTGNRTACLWDLRTGALVRELAGYKEHTRLVRFSPDG